VWGIGKEGRRQNEKEEGRKEDIERKTKGGKGNGL
jgi:hypothetical protein